MNGFNNIHVLDLSRQNFLATFDIICLSETWLNININFLPTYLNHYNYYEFPATKEAKKGRAIGGIVMLVNKALKSINVISKSRHWLFIKILIHNQYFVVGFVYFSPHYDFGQILFEFDLCIGEILQNYPDSPVLIGGDFNARIGELNQNEEVIFENSPLHHKRKSLDQTINQQGRLITEVMESQGMSVLNGRSKSDCPAQYTYLSKSGKSIIDYVWGNYAGIHAISDFLVSDRVLDSDHLLLAVTIHNYTILARKIKRDNHYPSRNRIAWDPTKVSEFSSVIESRWTESHDEQNASTSYNNFLKAVFDTATDLGILSSGQRIEMGNNQRWFNKTCKDSLRLTNKCYRTLKKNPNSLNLLTFLKSKQEHKIIIRNTKKTYLENIQLKLNNIKNPQEFWKTRKLLLNCPNSRNDLDNSVWDNYYLNFYGTPVENSIIFSDVRDPFLDSPITYFEVKTATKNLKNNKSPGLDKIPNEILKNLPESCLIRLTSLLNSFLNDEDIPKSLKQIELIPLPKKGDLQDPSNYRGIALCNAISKVYTQILANRLTTWVESFNIIPESQAGFRKNRSCIDNIFSMLSSKINLILKQEKYTLSLSTSEKPLIQ